MYWAWETRYTYKYLGRKTWSRKNDLYIVDGSVTFSWSLNKYHMSVWIGLHWLTLGEKEQSYDRNHHHQQQQQQNGACLTTGPKQVLNLLRSSTSTFNLHYSFVSLKSSSSCLRLLTRLSPLLAFLYPSFNNVF
jgi:hypothetical protein